MTKDWEKGGGGRHDRDRDREMGLKGGGMSRQGSTCLTKDIGEASLLCQDAWSHQWPSKSPVRWGGGHTYTRKDSKRGR